MDRFKFRAYKYAKLLEDVDSFFIDNLKEKITLHFSDCHTKTMKLSDCILEQCTGLKDKNGKLIYENDRVKFIWHDKEFKGTVIWYLSSWGIEISSRFIRLEENFGYDNPKNIEVIGNIHENKDLLEVK